MQNRINNILERYLNIRLTRIGSPLSLHGTKKKKGLNLIVELIGPSCIGKSTLYRHHLRHHQRQSNSNFVYGRKFRKNWSRYKFYDKPNFNKFHHQLLMDRFRFNANKTVSGLQKFKDLKHFHLLLEIDSWIENHMANRVVIFDEHLSGRLHNELPEDKEFKEFLANRCLINCWAPDDFHYSNITKRIEAGTNPSVYMGLSKSETLKKIRLKKTMLNSSLSYYRKRDVPILELNMADGLDHNCTLIDKFITTLADPLFNETIRKHA